MQVALVTGASKGFGRALSEGLIDRGWSLVIDARDAEGLAEAETALRAGLRPGQGLAAVVGDVADPSLEVNEVPYPEYFRVTAATANRINDTHRDGGRVVAVGTTVVRALETVVDARGHVHAGSGWTDLVVTADRTVRSLDGLLTGWHEPDASHLGMLEAIAGREVLESSYAAALAEGYLWHEFGDVHLVLP